MEQYTLPHKKGPSLVDILLIIATLLLLIAISVTYSKAQDLVDVPAPQNKCKTNTLETTYCQNHPTNELCIQDLKINIPEQKEEVHMQVTIVEPPAKPPRLFTFRNPKSKKPLRTNKQVIQSVAFWAGKAGSVAALVAALRNKNSGESAHSEVPAVAAVQALGFLGSKYMCECYNLGTDIYQIVHYSISAAQ